MAAIHTSPGEIQRTAIDALRGLGLSFAIADRATHALTWTQAVRGGALGFVRLNEDRIRAAIPRPFSYGEHRFGNTVGGVLDAGGKSLLESGLRALDLANAGARSAGIGIVLVRRTFGTLFLAELAASSARRGLGLLALCRPAALEGSGTGDRTEAVLGLPDGRVMVASPASGMTPAGDAVTDFLPLVERIAGAAASAGIAAALAESADPDGLSDMMLLSFDVAAQPGIDVAAAFGECAAGGRWHIAGDLQQRWQQAIDAGFDVDPLDWHALYALVARTRVVTSERSRSQAG